MPLTGDFDNLRRMVTELRTVNGLLDSVTTVAEGQVDSLFKGDFAKQQDPWGNTWSPTKTGKTPVLYQTGALANAAISSSLGTVRVRPPPYWVFHQVGANGMEPRGILPFSNSNWNSPIERAIDDQVKRHFKSAEG